MLGERYAKTDLLAWLPEDPDRGEREAEHRSLGLEPIIGDAELPQQSLVDRDVDAAFDAESGTHGSVDV